MMNKRYSIITVTWNNASGLSCTLSSIRNLKYPNIELIVIDGASKDNTPNIIEQNKDIITVSVSEKDNGIYNAMNKGIRYATGDYIVFMNAGDCFASEDTLSLVNKYDGDIILGGARYGQSVRMPLSNMTLYDILSLGINHQSTYYKSDVLKKYGFDEKYKLIADLKSVVEPMALDKANSNMYHRSTLYLRRWRSEQTALARYTHRKQKNNRRGH